ncbi:hypothetical protein BDW59DRAFT_178521 [Aspergillus cavernicola]|uniref:BTB domain-containing protein n=1 Tax=Aspergillus cavernicola TaxID=176166 RepID=A0ABR4HB28_9EURO
MDFQFQVPGPLTGEFTVHSYPFATLMNGGMIEAKIRRVEWQDVEGKTFTRLCEYAYLGDYTPPRLKRWLRSHHGWYGPEEEADDRPSPVPDAIEYEYPTTETAIDPDPWKLPYKEKNIWTRHLRDRFSNLTINAPPRAHHLNDFVPKQNTGPREDFTPVFLGHIQLYILADQYGIEALCQLVLAKLAKTLTNFKLYRTSHVGVLESVRFVYSDKYRNISGIAPSRRLAVCYVISVLGQLGDAEAFQDLLADGGDFVSDFWTILWNQE